MNRRKFLEKIARGGIFVGLAALSGFLFFKEETGVEPEEIYFRYYVRFGDSWTPLTGGKLPGIGGTYGKAGWGRRKSNGYNGWSARGLFLPNLPNGNPLAGGVPIGTYLYHAGMKTTYGDNLVWQTDQRGILTKNQWHSVEHYVKLNDPEKSNGILRGWINGRLAFEDTHIKFRTTQSLKIERIWLNVYHGGTKPTPVKLDVYIDNIVIAEDYIGPAERDREPGNTHDWWLKFGTLNNAINEAVSLSK